MVKKVLIIIVTLVFFAPVSDACVGKTLTIGITDTPEQKVFAEMLSTLVNERTGTTVKVAFYSSIQEIYDAVKEKKVDISIENTTQALHVLNLPPETDAHKAYRIVKENYEKEKGLVWLKPFGFTGNTGNAPPSYTATILRMEILNNFPALPRLFNKLGSTINDDTYTRLMQSVESGEKPKNVARDFLRTKKLI